MKRLLCMLLALLTLTSATSAGERCAITAIRNHHAAASRNMY